MKKEMRGVVLAGGTGSRLYPLTRVTNKHLLPVGNVPMLYHPIQKFVEAGIRKILIVVGIEHAGAVMGSLGSGKDFDAEFTYRVQDEAGGIAQALGLARGFAAESNVAVILGDNIFEDSMKPWVDLALSNDNDAVIVTKEVPDPSRYGVIRQDEAGKVVEILEKPKTPPSSLAVTGIYFYPPDVYDLVATLKPSNRGELEITDVNNHYIHSHRIQYVTMNGFWTDAGTFESLNLANQLVRRVSE